MTAGEVAELEYLRAYALWLEMRIGLVAALAVTSPDDAARARYLEWLTTNPAPKRQG